jgi:hypothetical protein
MKIMNTDSLLRKHQLLFDDETNRLVDWETRKPASKKRVKAYIADWSTNPGYPGKEAIMKLKEQS